MQVIWAIGASMIVLGFVVSWPRWLIAVCALGMVAGHNLLDSLQPEHFNQWGWIWNLLHVRGQLPYAFVLYPLVPWIAVIGLGFCAGTLFELEAQARRRMLLIAAAVCLALFVLLRLVNVYGDPHPWEVQASGVMTLLSFMNVHKYPPSLLYLLATLGIACFLLAQFETFKGRTLEVLLSFGRVPLFVYVLHIIVAHLAAGVLALALGFGDVLLRNVFIHKPDGWASRCQAFILLGSWC